LAARTAPQHLAGSLRSMRLLLLKVKAAVPINPHTLHAAFTFDMLEGQALPRV